MGVDAKVDQRANEHIPAESAEDVEVKGFHEDEDWAASALIWLAA